MWLNLFPLVLCSGCSFRINLVGLYEFIYNDRRRELEARGLYFPTCTCLKWPGWPTCCQTGESNLGHLCGRQDALPFSTGSGSSLAIHWLNRNSCVIYMAWLCNLCGFCYILLQKWKAENVWLWSFACQISFGISFVANVNVKHRTVRFMVKHFNWWVQIMVQLYGAPTDMSGLPQTVVWRTNVVEWELLIQTHSLALMFSCLS